MRHPSFRVLALSLALGTAGAAEAKSTTTDNLTVFSGTKALSPQQALRDNAERYGLPRSLDNLVLLKVQESLLGKHYRYQQMLLDLPVDNAQIVVSIGKNGQLLQIFNETRHVSADMDDDAVNQLHLKEQISSEAALDQAWTNMRVQQPLVALPKSERVWIPVKDGFQLVYKVEIAAQMPTGGFVQYLNAQDGRLEGAYSTSLPRTGKFEDRTLLSRFFVLGPPLDRKAATAALEKELAGASPTSSTALASGINGSGYVFNPDPRTTLNTDSLTDTSAATAFDAAYFTQSLRDITLVGGVYSLSGPYINIKDIEAPNTAPSTTTNGIWTAKRGNDAFDDTNVYFHIDQSQRYIQSLGFTNIINRPLDVDTLTIRKTGRSSRVGRRDRGEDRRPGNQCRQGLARLLAGRVVRDHEPATGHEDHLGQLYLAQRQLLAQQPAWAASLRFTSTTTLSRMSPRACCAAVRAASSPGPGPSAATMRTDRPEAVAELMSSTTPAVPVAQESDRTTAVRNREREYVFMTGSNGRGLGGPPRDERVR